MTLQQDAVPAATDGTGHTTRPMTGAEYGGGGTGGAETARKVPVSTASKVECRSSSASMTRASRRTPSRIRSGAGKQ